MITNISFYDHHRMTFNLSEPGADMGEMRLSVTTEPCGGFPVPLTLQGTGEVPKEASVSTGESTYNVSRQGWALGVFIQSFKLSPQCITFVVDTCATWGPTATL